MCERKSMLFLDLGSLFVEKQMASIITTALYRSFHTSFPYFSFLEFILLAFSDSSSLRFVSFLSYLVLLITDLLSPRCSILQQICIKFHNRKNKPGLRNNYKNFNIFYNSCLNGIAIIFFLRL